MARSAASARSANSLSTSEVPRTISRFLRACMARADACLQVHEVAAALCTIHSFDACNAHWKAALSWSWLPCLNPLILAPYSSQLSCSVICQLLHPAIAAESESGITFSGKPRSRRELGLSGRNTPPKKSRVEGTKAKPKDRRHPQLSAWVTASTCTAQILASMP